MQDTTPSISSFKKEQYLFFVLGAIFITNVLVAELIGSKIFSLERFLNLPPAQISLITGFSVDFNMSVGVIIWPIVFIISDIVNEYFGREGVKKITFLCFGLIIYTFFIVYVAIKLPPADFWIDVNKTNSPHSNFNINYAFSAIFGQSMNIIIASLTAFLIGQFTDAYSFYWLRKITNNGKKWIRATGSTVISQLIDSFVVLFLAYYILGEWSIKQVIAVGLVQYSYKLFMAIVLTPVIYLANYGIDLYLGKDKVKELAHRAMQ
jgi:uncharacterized integral membrane protein (TIGR00697 family)